MILWNNQCTGKHLTKVLCATRAKPSFANSCDQTRGRSVL